MLDAPGEHRRGGRAAERGQVYAVLALAMVVLCGGLALAIDVGVTNADYQSLLHVAQNASRAGAFTLYGKRIGVNAASDAGIWTAIDDKLTAAGYVVKNGMGVAAPADPCTAGYSGSQVAMTATYLDMNDAVITSTGTAPWTVGSGSMPASAWGVQVKLSMCQLPGFGAVLGHPSYTLRAQAAAGRPAVGQTATPGPTATPTMTLTPSPTTTTTPMPTATATPTNTSSPTQTGTPTSSPTVTPTPCSGASCSGTFSVVPFAIYAAAQSSSPYAMLFASGSADLPAGNAVTLQDNGWAGEQYTNRSEALAGTPGNPTSVSLHDSSFKGCLLPTTASVTINGLTAFDHGGNGNCGSLPSAGTAVAVPIIDQAYKNEDPCMSMGGYCAHVIGIAQVLITYADQNTLAGTIVGNDGPGSDPYNIIETAVPTATPTATATATNTPPPTNTSTSTPTYTLTPTVTSTPTVTPTPTATPGQPGTIQ